MGDYSGSDLNKILKHPKLKLQRWKCIINQ